MELQSTCEDPMHVLHISLYIIYIHNSNSGHYHVEVYLNSQLCPNNLAYAVHGKTHWCVPSSVQVTVRMTMYLVYVHAHNLIICVQCSYFHINNMNILLYVYYLHDIIISIIECTMPTGTRTLHGAMYIAPKERYIYSKKKDRYITYTGM